MNPFLVASRVAFLAFLRCLLLSACGAWDSLIAVAEVHLAQVVRHRSCCHLFTELSRRENSLFLFTIRILHFGPVLAAHQNQNQSATISFVSRNLPKSNRHRGRALFSLLK